MIPISRPGHLFHSRPTEAPSKQRFASHSFALLAALCLFFTSSSVYAEDAADGEDQSGIRVRSQPRGATIYLDGVRAGQTPTTVTAPPGRHEVVLEYGGQRFITHVRVRQSEMAQLSMDLEPESAVDDDWEDDSDDEGRVSEQDQRRRGSDDATTGSWARRVNRWPFLHVTATGAPLQRVFSVPINPEFDCATTPCPRRETAEVLTGFYGGIGFDIGLYPFARFDALGIRGLGFEGSALFGVGIDTQNLNGVIGIVDSSYYEVDLDLVYRLVLGSPDAGAELMLRVGWHRTAFEMDEVNNDLLPSFVYDGVRFDLGVNVPLRTRHMLGVLRGAYLLLPTPGGDAEVAYGAPESETTVHGMEFRVGFVWRIGALDISAIYSGRFIYSRFTGIGLGTGHDPSTRPEEGGAGIETTDRAEDGYHQIRLSLGYRW